VELRKLENVIIISLMQKSLSGSLQFTIKR